MFFSVVETAHVSRDQVILVDGGSIMLPTPTHPTFPVVTAAAAGAAVIAFVSIFGQWCVHHAHDARSTIVAMMTAMMSMVV